MKTLIILLLLCGVAHCAEPTVYIAVDNTRESRWVSEFVEKTFAERYNLQNGESEPPWEVKQLDNLRKEILPNILLVSLYDIELREKHRIPNVSCPAYRIGRYGVWKPFSKKAGVHPTYCMHFLKFVIDDYTFDSRTKQWEKDVLLIKYITLMEYGDDMAYNLYEEYCYDYDTLLYCSVADRRAGQNIRLLPVIAYRPKPIITNPIGFELEE